ncbi:HEAT repeat-containing protein 6 [Chamberlinius hualienensis]
MNYQQEEFELWSTRLLELEPTVGVGDVENVNGNCQQLNQIIDNLNSFNFESRFVNNKVGEEILVHCTLLIPLSNDHLVTKFSPLIVHLLRKQNVNLTKETAAILCKYLLNALGVCSQWLHPDILLALSTLLFSNASKLDQFWENLIAEKGVLTNFADPHNSQVTFEIRYYSVRCIEYLTVKEPNQPYLTQEMTQRIFAIFLSNLSVISTDQVEDILHCKLRSSCFIGLQNIILESKTSIILSLGELLATLKVHVFYGLSNQSQLLLTTCLYPSPLSQSYFNQETPKPNTKDGQSSKSSTHNSRSKKRRSSSKKMAISEQRVVLANNLKYTDDKSDEDKSPCHRGLKPFIMTKLVSSSESEFSDSEGGNAARLRSAQTRVRHSALAALFSVVKVVDRKIMFGYWSSFLPDAPSSVGTLTSCLLKDPAPKVRCGALMVVSCMLEGSSPFLALADEKDKSKMAFTTLSSTVTSTVRELHRTLILALVAETSTLVLTQIIKSITHLIQNAPVPKLSEGFLTKIAKQLKPFLSHKDSNVKVAALTAFGAILSVYPTSPEVLDILLWRNGSRSTSLEHSSNLSNESVKLNDENSSWLIEICLANILQSEALQPLPVRLESLQVLAIVVKEHFLVSRVYIKYLKSVVESGLANKDVSLRLHCARLLEELGRSMSQALESDNSKIQLQIEEVVSFWSSLLKTSLPGILQVPVDETNFQALAVHGCNCLSTIGGEAFASLSRNQQLFCQSVLLGLSCNDSKNIKASAIRGLGVLVLFPSLREDGAFLLDVLEKIVEAMNDANLEVRLKAAWALGNLTDVLIINQKSLDDHVIEDYQLDDSSLKQLIKAAINASKDIDRVSSNGVRALGNLMRFLDNKHLGNIGIF